MTRITDDNILSVLNHRTWKTVSELCKELKIGKWRQTQMYPNLHRLERAELVEWRWREQSKPRRMEYRLSPTGTERRARILEARSTPPRTFGKKPAFVSRLSFFMNPCPGGLPAVFAI
jgi:DNA-binding PadR family transcriptional regulator